MRDGAPDLRPYESAALVRLAGSLGPEAVSCVKLTGQVFAAWPNAHRRLHLTRPLRRLDQPLCPLACDKVVATNQQSGALDNSHCAHPSDAIHITVRARHLVLWYIASERRQLNPDGDGSRGVRAPPRAHRRDDRASNTGLQGKQSEAKSHNSRN